MPLFDLLQMVYCSVCCEPFHRFCLEDAQRPLKDSKENWACPRCLFCHVCGKQNNVSIVIIFRAFRFQRLGENINSQWSSNCCEPCRTFGPLRSFFSRTELRTVRPKNS